MPKNIKPKTSVKWTVVPDNNINCIWECAECKSKAEVTPDWYQNNGTPVCSDCDCDMEYLRTEIKS